jgi:hypothetical protein
MYDDANDCYITYRFHYASIIDYMIFGLCGFGLRPLNTILSAITIMTIFGLIYCFAKDSKSTKSSQKMWDALAFSAVALFSLPKELYPYGEKKYTKLMGQNPFGVPFRMLVFFERLIGWGLLILFINTLSRVMIQY